jgi:hypothetical protein
LYVLVLGLPFAIIIGWLFGAPAAPLRPVSAPLGVGALGTAPTHALKPRPVTPVEWSPRPATRMPMPRLVAASALPTSPAPAIEATSAPSPTPIFTLPPSPIPTSITPSPSEPSPTPSETPEPESSGIPSASPVCKR